MQAAVSGEMINDNKTESISIITVKTNNWLVGCKGFSIPPMLVVSLSM
jgi:hypothetical protein